MKYDIISKLLQDDLGYKLIDHKVDADGHKWTYVKNGKTIDMNENTIYSYYVPSAAHHQEILARAHENLLNEIKKNPLKLD